MKIVKGYPHLDEKKQYKYKMLILKDSLIQYPSLLNALAPKLGIYVKEEIYHDNKALVSHFSKCEMSRRDAKNEHEAFTHQRYDFIYVEYRGDKNEILEAIKLIRKIDKGSINLVKVMIGVSTNKEKLSLLGLEFSPDIILAPVHKNNSLRDEIKEYLEGAIFVDELHRLNKKNIQESEFNLIESDEKEFE